MNHRITIGLLLCMYGLVLLHGQQIFIGLPAFLLGFYLMNKKR